MLALTEKQTLIRALGQVISDKVRDELAPFRKQIADLETAMAKHREEGRAELSLMMTNYVTEQFEQCLPKVRDGIDGKDGKDGVDGKDGKDGVDWDYINEQLSAGMQMLSDQLEKKIAELPKPEKGEKGDKGDPGEPGKDGRDGTDGIDGKSVSVEQLRDVLADLVVKAIGDIPIPRSCVGGFIDRNGHLFLSFSDGGISDLGEVIGRNGSDCNMETVKAQVAAYLATIEKPKDGKDGLGFDDLQLEFDGERLVQLKFIRGDEAKVFDLDFPVPIHRDIWKAGEYGPGDIVTRDGSMWIAQKKTVTVPGAPDSDWKLCTKRGRDGKDGKQGPEGPAGKAGRDGRDLTQVGPDGRKW